MVRLAHGLGAVLLALAQLLLLGAPVGRVESDNSNAKITQDDQRGGRITETARLGTAGFRENGVVAATRGDFQEEATATPFQGDPDNATSADGRP